MLPDRRMKIGIVMNQNPPLPHHHQNHFQFDDNYQLWNKVMKLNNLDYVYLLMLGIL